MGRHSHIIEIEIFPDPDMGLDDPSDVLEIFEELVRDSGLENGADVSLSIRKGEDITDD